MNLKKIDFFSPWIVVVAILAFLAMGYIGSFNYRFDNPLNQSVILTILLSCGVFLAGSILVKYSIKLKKSDNLKLTKTINNFLSEKVLLYLVLIALFLQILNLVTIGGIPLFDSVLKSNATTILWRISYLLFLPAMNILLAKDYKRRYLILVLIGAIVYGLNGYRTSVIGVLGSAFITLYYIKKINKKIAFLFIALIAVCFVVIGYIASQSISNQHWMLNPIQLIFYRAAFTLEVFEKILTLGGTTHGHIISMIFSSGSPRTFIGEYVLHYTVCLTSTIFGPVYLDFGLPGLIIQMFFLGVFLKIINEIAKLKKGIGIGIYSIIMTHTLIWIETGPTDIMIWIFFLMGVILIILNYNYLK